MTVTKEKQTCVSSIKALSLNPPFHLGLGMGKKKFVINEEACRAAGDSEETIKWLKKETRKLKT